MKKLLVATILAGTIGSAQAVSAINHVAYPANRPLPPAYVVNHNSYNAGYNNGYHKGKEHRDEQIAKAVGATILIAAGVLVIYELAKPSQNNPGQVQLATF